MTSDRRRWSVLLAGLLAIGTVGAPVRAGDATVTVMTGVPGLYGTETVAIDHGPGWADVTSALPCDEVEEVLGAGDWTIADRFVLPQARDAGVEDRFLSLTRGSRRAVARLRGATGTCAGWVGVLQERPFVASGPVDVASTATMLPLICVRQGDGTVYVDGLLDVVGGWLGRVALTFLPVEGVRPLDADVVATAGPSILRTDRPLFSVMTDPDPPELPELVPGTRFAGSVEVVGLDPLAAHVTMEGLEDRSGRRQALDAWLDCRLRDASRSDGPTEPVATSSVTMRLEVDDRTRVRGGFSVTSRQTVVIEATLEQVVPGRWEATGEAVASGSFTEPDMVDFEGDCTGRWSGSQPVDVLGVEGGGRIVLTVTPAGPPAVTMDDPPCNADTHTQDPSFPWGTMMGVPADFAWPPGTPETDAQTVRQRIPGIGSITWTLALSPAS